MSQPIVHKMFDDIYVGAGRDWVDPRATREKLVSPSAYDAFYVWRIGDVYRCETIDTRTLSQDSRGIVATVKADLSGDWSNANLDQINAFLRFYSNRNLNAIALAEHCDAQTGIPYWIVHFKEVR